MSKDDIKEGEGKNGPWKLQNITVRDYTGEIKLALWNGDITRGLEVGAFYKLDNPYWNTHDGKPQLSLGKYCTIQECTKDDMIKLDGFSDEQTEWQFSGSPNTTSQTQTAGGKTMATDEERLDFAETALIRFITTCNDQGLSPKEFGTQVGAVYNTALMQKK